MGQVYINIIPTSYYHILSQDFIFLGAQSQQHLTMLEILNELYCISS